VERWFLELQVPLFQYLRTLGCGHSLADEITQEAFLRLHHSLRAGLQLHDVRGWMFRVARNLWIDSRREQQHFWTPHRDEAQRPDPMPVDAAPDPEQQAIRREWARLIEEELLRMPKLQRECMRLKSQGLRYHEIAAALGISMTAAVDRVRRGVEKLRRRLNPGD
jgi:RNA polymerase sigma factor (sigma-70 family)